MGGRGRHTWLSHHAGDPDRDGLREDSSSDCVDTGVDQSILFHVPLLGLEKAAGPVPLPLVTKGNSTQLCFRKEKGNKCVKEQYGCKNLPHKL